jgi:hypothetical protein
MSLSADANCADAHTECQRAGADADTSCGMLTTALYGMLHHCSSYMQSITEHHAAPTRIPVRYINFNRLVMLPLLSLMIVKTVMASTSIVWEAVKVHVCECVCVCSYTHPHVHV